MFRKLLIYSAIFSLVTALKRCDNRLCNNEAECLLEDNKPSCKCIGKTFFTGETCQELVNNCAPNPCMGGAPCYNHLGQYYCECPGTDLGGQNCNIRKQDLFRHVYLHYNRLAALQTEHTFLLMLENDGVLAFTAELFTNDTFIDGMTYGRNVAKYKGQLKKSNNLIALAKSLGLKHAERIPFKRGYYRVSRAIFYLAGIKELTLGLTDMGDKELLYMQTFGMYVYVPDSMGCVPEIVAPLCSRPKPILHMDVSQYNVVEPTVKKRCARSSVISYKWSVKNFLGTVHLHNFKPVKSAILKIAPYRMWFSFRDEYFSSFLLYAEVEEVFGTYRGITYVRCYAYIDPKPVKAYIAGGAERSVSHLQTLIMDGSKCRNFAFAPNENQYLRYRWSCASTDDGANKACKEKIGSERNLVLPAGKLSLGKSYTFTLYTKSTENLYNADRYEQLIKVEKEYVLLVDFKCVRNCEKDKFTPAKIVHLKAVCMDCSSFVTTIYAWTQNGNAVSDQERLVFTPGNEAESNIELVIKEGSRSGKVQLKLTKNTPPEGGDCAITPTDGNEFTTEFQIECQNYEDEDMPLRYEYLADEMTLERTGNPVLKLHLPKLDKLKVQICDALRACTEKQLTVSLTPLEVPQNVAALKQLLHKDDFNIRTLLKDGKTRQGLLLADILLKQAPSLEFANQLMSQMANFEVEVLLVAEQFTAVTHHLLKPLQPLDNEKAALFAQFFTKLVQGYENIISDGDVQDLLKDPYKLLSNSLVDMLKEFSVPLEDIQEVQILPEEQDLSNPLAEHYPDFPKFDITILPRIENWLKAAVQLNKCIYRLGILAANMHLPAEKPYVVEQADLTMEVFAFESGKVQKVKSKDEAVSLIMNAAVTAELEEQLGGSELVLQVVSLQKNPFWWYPDEQPLSSSVVYFSAFSKQRKLDSTISLQNAFEFTIKLRPSPAQKVATSYVETSLDMPIFDVDMPANSILIVKFRATAVSLRVMLSLGVKPRGFMVRKSKQIVPAGIDVDQSVVLSNDKEHESTGYIAVMAAYGVKTRAEFTFEFFLHECLSWDFSLADPQWTTSGCIPSEHGTTATELYCRCHHLSSFSGKVFPTSAKAVPGERQLLKYVAINWQMVSFYTALVLLFGFLLWYARKKWKQTQSEYLMIERTDRDDKEDFDIVLLIHTGSHWNAGTTANVHLSLAMRWDAFKKYTIYQNPAKPKLTQNSTCVLKLPIASGDLKTNPIKLILENDGFGRYSSWYCHSIEVKDLQTQQTTICPVAKWISTTPLHLEIPEDQKTTRFSQFKEKLMTLYINWFGFQALCGPWKYGNEPLDRSERTMIWIIKVSITICIIACYFGSTTLETYEEEREIYHNLSIGAGLLFILSIICYLVGLLVDLALVFVVKYV